MQISVSSCATITLRPFQNRPPRLDRVARRRTQPSIRLALFAMTLLTMQSSNKITNRAIRRHRMHKRLVALVSLRPETATTECEIFAPVYPFVMRHDCLAHVNRCKK